MLARIWVVVGALFIAGVAVAAETASPSAPIPEGAIAVEGGAYQVPIGRDDDGCMMYQMHVPGQAAAQVISYRRADGTFTVDKREAVCGSGEK